MPREDQPRQGYAKTAASGTRWATAQGIVNKVATALSMLIVARALSPADFGLASIVIVASGFVMVFPMLVMADIIVTHQRHSAAIARAVRVVTLWAVVAVVLTMIGTAPFIAGWYSEYPLLPMAALLALSALRPIGEALMIVPLARLRVQFRYREIAVISGAVQLGATILTVIWAIAWPGAAAIVMPQVIAAIVKAFWFMAAARKVPSKSTVHMSTLERRSPQLSRLVFRRIASEFALASMAQYVHTVVSGLPLLVVSRFVSETEMGLFGFALALACQAAAILAQQLALVLQPIFGRLKSDPQRQVAGYMRVVGLIAAVMGPIAMLQAALAEPLFALVFGEKWLPAVPFFVAFSIGQAFSFQVAPAKSLIKAQGRFGTYFIWQVLHAVLGLGLFLPAVMSWGAMGVAWIDTAIWVVSMPIIVWIGARPGGVAFGTVLRAFILPWLTAGPIALAVWGAWWLMPGPSKISAAIALVVFGPVGLFFSIVAVRILQPELAAEFSPFLRRLLLRVPLIGKRAADTFASAPASS